MKAKLLSEKETEAIAGGAIVYNEKTRKYDILDGMNLIESYDTYDSAFCAAYMIGCNSDLYNSYYEYNNAMLPESYWC